MQSPATKKSMRSLPAANQTDSEPVICIVHYLQHGKERLAGNFEVEEDVDPSAFAKSIVVADSGSALLEQKEENLDWQGGYRGL